LPGKDHIEDWNRAFGISDATSEKAIEPLWDIMQKLIDRTKNMNEEKGSDYKRVKDSFDWFNWGSYGHRLFFHWGFNADLRQYAPLRVQLEKCLNDYAKTQIEEGKHPAEIKEECKKQKEAFYKLLFKIQGERNRLLINKLVAVTQIPTSRGYANAVASILYDVHLLGDYATKNPSALPDIKSLEYDLEDKGFKRLLLGGESEKLEEIRKELKSVINVGRGRTNKKRAELLVEVTARFLPEILEARFKNTLMEKGITITVPKSTVQNP
jgi:hypothetical protein